jgi:hypothetical protein
MQAAAQYKTLAKSLKADGITCSVKSTDYDCYLQVAKKHGIEVEVARVLGKAGWKRQQTKIAYGGFSGEVVMSKGDVTLSLCSGPRGGSSISARFSK